MKYTLLLVPFIVIMLFPPTIFALVTLPPVTTGASSSAKASASARRLETQTQRIASLKTRADTEIDRRIASMNKLIEKIGMLQRLSADKKVSLTTQIQTEITNLTTLKAKIDADTDLATLTADTKSIILSYRVYALFVPEIQILITADILNETAEKSASLSAKLQTQINEASAKGKEVSGLQTLFADMQNDIADAKKQALDAQNTVTPLTPAGFPGNRSTLQRARTMLQTGHKDLETARQIAKRITQALKLETLGKPELPHATGSAATAASASAHPQVPSHVLKPSNRPL